MSFSIGFILGVLIIAIAIFYCVYDDSQETDQKDNILRNQRYYLIPDTSYLISCAKNHYNSLAEIINKGFRKNIFFKVKIHNLVMKELDGLKKNPEKKLYACKAIKYIQETQERFHCVEISDFGIDRPYTKFEGALASKTDAMVLTLAKVYSEQNQTFLLTTDSSMKILARNYLINLEDKLPVNTKNFFKTQGSDDYYNYKRYKYRKDATGCNLGYGFGLDDDEYYY